MPDEITFMDLACLMSLTPDITFEKFGSAINSSIFDASNLAGTLKQKQLIDFSSYYPGPNTIVISETGKTLMAEADTKATTPFDTLDQEVLTQVSGGKRIPIELQNTLNIRSKDLALHLYKLWKQGLIIYELRSGTVNLQLTEAGYLKAKGTPTPTPGAAAAATPQDSQMGMPAAQMKPPTPSPTSSIQMPTSLTPQPGTMPSRTTPPPPPQPPHPMPGVQAAADPKPAAPKPQPNNTLTYAAIAVIIVLILLALFYFYVLKK